MSRVIFAAKTYQTVKCVSYFEAVVLVGIWTSGGKRNINSIE